MDITADNVAPLLYAAKKYLLTGLITECLEVLEKSISVENICTVLMQAMALNESELKRKCITFIGVHTCNLFDSETFLQLTTDALVDIVSMDVSVASERQIFENCMKWARYQLREMGEECPSDEDIRSALGNVLYKIRFPTMTPAEFAELTAHSKVLSAEEKHDIYVYLTTGEKLETLKFLTERRGKHDCVVSRFTMTSSNCNWGYSLLPDAISFETTENMCLTGVVLYGGCSSAHDVKVEVLKGSEKLSTTVTKMTSLGRSRTVKVSLENPVCIYANNKYTVIVLMQGPSTFSGINGIAKCDFPNSSRIAFYDCELSSNRTNVSRGQIPQLYFSHVLQYF